MIFVFFCFKTEQGFVRNVMSAPVRRPPYRFLRSGKLKSIPKLDFSLTDVDDDSAKETAASHTTTGREVLKFKQFFYLL